MLLYRYKLQEIQTAAVATITRNIDLEEGKNEAALNCLIDVFDSQVQSVVSASLDDMSKPHFFRPWPKISL
jgi:hypothetical protein